jgi:hypothetical protein
MSPSLTRVGRTSAILTLLSSTALAEPCGGQSALAIPATAFRLIESESGPVNYYRVVSESSLSFVRSDYQPPYETAVIGFRIPEADRANVGKLSWAWRAQRLPREGNECAPGKGDSAAVVYVTWKRGIRYYTLKYVWSTIGPHGGVCAKKRNPFVAQDTVILRSGGPLGTWQSETVDLPAVFRKHFADGDPKASVPDLIGIALMSDGDQTESQSSADFGRFSLSLVPRC